MAEKGFGVKEVNLIGASGTPTITSPNNLNLNAVNVAISTNASIGGNLTVSGTVGIAGTLTYEDVTNIDSVGLITARSGILVKDDATFETANSNNIVFDKSDNALEFGNGVKSVFNNNLQIYNDGNNRFKGSSGGMFFGLPGSFQIGDGNFSNTKFEATGTHAILYSAGVKVARSHENRFEVGNPDVGIGIGATISTIGNAQFVGVVTASSFIGSGANLTGIAVTEAPVTDYTITGDGSHYYFHGGGVDETAGDPDLYLIRGQKYRFNNTTGSSHPFEFRIANGGSAYSNGVSGDDEGVQFFTVPYDAPARIFYQCTIHGGMVGNIYIRGANGNNDYVGLTTFRDNVRINQSAGTDERLDINEQTTTNPLRLMQTATEASIQNIASQPFKIRSQGGSGSNGYLAFWTRENERLRIAPDGTIHVNSSDSASGGRIYATGSALYLQSGNGRHTFKVSDTSAGNNRTIEMTSAGNLKFPAGATIGIDFSAKTNLGGATDTTLAHYEEGTWTPSLTNLNNASHVTTNWATYTRVGRIVTISVKFTISSSINDGSGLGFNLPFGPISDRQILIPAISDRSGSNTDAFAFNNVLSDHNVYAKALDGYAFQNYNSFSGNYIIVTGSYETDA